MRAAVVHQIGSPPTPEEIPEPEPREGEALLDVLAAAVRPLDRRIAAGDVEGGPPAPSYVAGAEGIGRIVTAPGGRVGTLAWFPFTARSGSFAERAVVTEGDLVPLPPDSDPLASAAFGGAGTLAGLALEWRAQLRPAESVLVLEAPDVLGQVTIQAAKLLGASRVVVAAHDPQTLTLAEELGADQTVELEGRSPAQLAHLISRATESLFDVVIDSAWGAAASAAITLLREGGRLVTVAAAAGRADLPSLPMRARNLAVLGLSNVATPADLRATTFTKLFSQVQSGRIRLEYNVVPLSDIESAWRGLTSIVISPIT